MKDFIILAPKNAITYACSFPYFKEGVLSCGINLVNYFYRQDNKTITAPALWFNTFGVSKEPLPLTEKYTPENYPKYDDFDAINADRCKDIPCDYFGQIGVPVTFLTRQNDDFEILGLLIGEFTKIDDNVLAHQQKINGKDKFSRVVIQKKK